MTEHILQFFAYSHLPPHLQAVSQPFGEMAQKIVDDLPRNPERTVALRKLLFQADDYRGPELRVSSADSDSPPASPGMCVFKCGGVQVVATPNGFQFTVTTPDSDGYESGSDTLSVDAVQDLVTALLNQRP